jgi:capsule polysaccharide modification protein KpsS
MTVDFDALAPALPDIVYAKAVSCAVWLNESYLYHYPAGSQGHLVGAVGDNNNAWRYFSIMIDRPATTTNATSVVSSFSAVPGQARFHLNQAPGDDNTFDISAFNIRGYWK